LSTGQTFARKNPQRQVLPTETKGTRLENLRRLAPRERDDVLVEEDACLRIWHEALSGEIKYHGPGSDDDLFEHMLNGRRQSVRLRDLIRVIRNSRLSTRAGNAADLVLRRLAAMRGLAVIPLNGTDDRRHRAVRREGERRRA
jgi:hypothetical protein